METISVPDIPATELTALAKKECKLTYLNSDFASWDYYKGLDGKEISGRGKTFEVMTWEPKRLVTSHEIREYFHAQGFYGHTGAFTAWFKERKPQGFYASFPEDNALWRHSEGYLCIPRASRDNGGSGLSRAWFGEGCGYGWVFVAFRELSPLNTQTINPQKYAAHIDEHGYRTILEWLCVHENSYSTKSFVEFLKSLL